MCVYPSEAGMETVLQSYNILEGHDNVIIALLQEVNSSRHVQGYYEKNKNDLLLPYR